MNTKLFNTFGLVVCAVLCLSLSLNAADRVYMADATAEPSSNDNTLPVMVEIDQNATGFQLAIKYDPALIEITGFDGSTGALSEAQWLGTWISQADGELTIGAVLGLDAEAEEFNFNEVIEAGADIKLGDLSYNVTTDQETTTEIAFQNSLPGILSSDRALDTFNLYTDVDGATVDLDLSTMTLTIEEEIIVVPDGFRRGDVDSNGALEITDAINNLSYQFLGTYSPACFDACDFDDNGKIELTDPIGNLSHQFLGMAPPAPPGKDVCGPDPTDDDELDCADPPSNC